MKTILLADDEPNLRLLVRTTLEGPEHRVLEASDGVSALETAERELPDVIVLDWMMPGMSGLEVARAIRRHPELRHVPIIMLTAKSQEKERQLGFAAGCDAFMHKPFSPLELLERVEEICRTAGAARL